MKFFTINNDPTRIYFQNIERRPLREEFNKVKEELAKCGCAIGPKKEVCTADIYECNFSNGEKFDLIFDETDDGTCLYLKSSQSIEQVKQIFEYQR